MSVLQGRRMSIQVVFVLFLLLLLSGCSIGFQSVTATQDDDQQKDNDDPTGSIVTIPTFALQDLLSIRHQNNNHSKKQELKQELKDTLTSTGLLAVRFNDDEYPYHRQVALQGLCDCHDHPEFIQSGQHQTRSMVLPDGITRRTSVATATVGLEHPLPLPESLLESVCAPETVTAMEGLRDVVADVSKAFVSALEDIFVEYNNHIKVPLLQDQHGGKTYMTLTSILESANHLEHFHVYTKETRHHHTAAATTTTTNKAAWEWHTDAGLFLVFVPAWNCLQLDNQVIQDTSFWYRDSQGHPVQAHFDQSNTVIIMLGQGAEDWLNLAAPAKQDTPTSSLRLKATVHSLRWDDQEQSSFFQQHQRAWYGMMFLVPETARIYGTKTLKDIRSSLTWSTIANEDYQPLLEETNNVHTSPAFPILGCDVSNPPTIHTPHDPPFAALWSMTVKRRRLQHQDPSACNNSTNFFCWMQCLDVPNANQAQGYVNEGYSLYCLDPAILSSSNNRVSEAAAPCQNGWVHNANCLGSWQPTAPGVPAGTINVTAANATNGQDQPFCYSGTTMVSKE
jgi:hypothetical protein